MDKALAVGLAAVLVAACYEAPTEPVAESDAFAAAAEVPGRPGRYEVFYAFIDDRDDYCEATYDEEYGDYTIYSPWQDAKVRVTENKNWVKATCKFTDVSGINESNAEVGYITYCELKTEDDRYFFGGTGTVTAAANNGEEDGGNVTIQCKFHPDDEGPA